jgi:hypothetical protein
MSPANPSLALFVQVVRPLRHDWHPVGRETNCLRRAQVEERRQVPLELKLEADEKAPRHFAPVAPQPIVLGPALEQKITFVSRAEFPAELVFGPKKGHASAATVKRP